MYNQMSVTSTENAKYHSDFALSFARRALSISASP